MLKSLNGMMKLAAASQTQKGNIDNAKQGTEPQDLQQSQNYSDDNASPDYIVKSRHNESVQPNFAISCPCCSVGNFPDPNGIHRCIVCSIPVHALDQCSVAAPGSEEGYGQKKSL